MDIDAARSTISRAREMGHTRGALYAWRTINGNECSAYYPAGTAQYHINADVAFAVSRYVESTGDNQFLLDMGAEILFETAELWLDLGFYNPEKSGQFCINSVTGPDEYNVLVNNNYYTNIMAQANLRKAAAAARYLKQKHPDRYLELKQALNMDLDDLTGQWQQASDRMYLPSDKAKDILLQDDAFLDRIPWDFQNVPRSQYPLLLHSIHSSFTDTESSSNRILSWPSCCMGILSPLRTRNGPLTIMNPVQPTIHP